MRRTLIIIVCAFICVLGTSCGIKSQDKNTDAQEHMQERTEKQSQEFLSENNTEIEAFQVQPNEMENCVEVVDLASGDIFGKISYGEHESLVGVYEYEEGFALIKEESEQGSDVSKYGDIVIVTDEMESDTWSAYVLELYDYDLKKTNSISLLEYIKEADIEIESDPILSTDAKKIAWLLSDSIYCIDLSKKTSDFSYATFKEDIYLTKIAFVGNDKIGFYGQKGYSERDTYYGYLDLKEDIVCYEVAKNYHASTLFTNNRYVCVNEWENPYTGETGGKVLVFDTQKNTSQEVAVDGLESTCSIISEDGKKMISVNWFEEKKYRIRNYDMETRKVIYETICEMDENVRPVAIKKCEDTYIVVYFSTKWGFVYATDHS